MSYASDDGEFEDCGFELISVEETERAVSEGLSDDGIESDVESEMCMCGVKFGFKVLVQFKGRY